jgi:hypothetical protein
MNRHLLERQKYKTNCDCAKNIFIEHVEAKNHFKNCFKATLLIFFSLHGKENIIENKGVIK